MDPALAAFAAKLGAKLLNEALKIKPHVHGEWLGTLDFDKDAFRKLYLVRQPAEDPLRLWIPELGYEYAYRGGFQSDGGSIPTIFQAIKQLRLKPDSFLRSYFLHDFCYATASCWVRQSDAPTWARMELNREMADCLLYVGLTAEDATLAEARTIYRAVRIGGGIAWRSHRREDA
jgi:hypothetical protein